MRSCGSSGRKWGSGGAGGVVDCPTQLTCTWRERTVQEQPLWEHLHYRMIPNMPTWRLQGIPSHLVSCSTRLSSIFQNPENRGIQHSDVLHPIPSHLQWKHLYYRMIPNKPTWRLQGRSRRICGHRLESWATSPQSLPKHLFFVFIPCSASGALVKESTCYGKDAPTFPHVGNFGTSF